MAEGLSPDGRERRDIVKAAALAMVGVGGAAALWPLLAQFATHPGSPPRETVSVDLATIPPGTSHLLAWRTLPVLVRHRTDAEISRAWAAPQSGVRDALARNDNLTKETSATDANRATAGGGRWLVIVGVCTHMPCLLKEQDLATRLGEGVGWFCPCCASRYDLSGRVLSGPAPENLRVPPFVVEGNVMRIG